MFKYRIKVKNTMSKQEVKTVELKQTKYNVQTRSQNCGRKVQKI
jgi:hypothetical protein